MSHATPIRFLLGPAGSGKTFTCLAEIRAELKRSPEGPPLILLAPKQATYQLERQLLEDGELEGYTRLQILSFERLAAFVLAALHQPEPKLLDDEGRVMILRALLMRRSKNLKIFHASARLPGFAQQLGQLLRELRRARLNPARLRELAAKSGRATQLQAKLHDLALLLDDYEAWLKTDALRDTDQLLDIAAAALNQTPLGIAPPELGGLWLDGFAEMAPQELELLAALLPRCEGATLAFCLEQDLEQDPAWLSTWSVVAQTYRRCRHAMEGLPNAKIEVRTLPRDPHMNRFAANETLAHLEKSWTNETPLTIAHQTAILRTVTCLNPEAEATLAAREVRRFVRADPARRFRDCAVLLRSLDAHHDALRRTFTRFGIPFFLDRREPVAHHPLAELTRFAVRVAAHGWRHDDWFGALKTGLVSAFEEQIDRLENVALEYGIEGRAWCSPLALKPAEENERAQKRADETTRRFELLRKRLVMPFTDFSDAVIAPSTGPKLAEAIRGLWSRLRVADQLEKWSRDGSNQVHATVWQQMQDWLANVERAFPDEALPLREWLPILEAGLAGLSVGVVPPALDQVLIGTVDRSRNPDLKLAIVLGMNEAIFPAPPSAPPLFSEMDRQTLDDEGVFLGPSARHRLGHERYYGYIACTRARERLVLSYAEADADGRKRNPSPFLAHLQRIFPSLTPEKFLDETTWRDAEHPSELLPEVLRNAMESSETKEPTLAALTTRPEFEKMVARQAALADATRQQRVEPSRIDAIHGGELKSSVSRLEDFAACPFKFFVANTLRAEERKEFEVDARQRGSFQHELLNRFHSGLVEEKKRWRDITPAEAASRIRASGESLLPTYAGGRFTVTASGRFTGQVLITATTRLMETLISWMAQYEFDPSAVEVGFGLPESSLPAWTLELDAVHRLALRGRIDRVDICRDASDGTAFAVVIDYKSSEHNLNADKMHNGLQLQLPAYLAALVELPEASVNFQATKIVPVGIFYVNLRGTFGSSADSRVDAYDAAEQAAARLKGYRHVGMFDNAQIRKLDNRAASKGDQFAYSFKKDGTASKNGNEGVPSPQFQGQLDQIREQLISIGRGIFSGEASVNPYKIGSGSALETACQRCDFRGVCRFDPWVDKYRSLTPAFTQTQSGQQQAAE